LSNLNSRKLRPVRVTAS